MRRLLARLSRMDRAELLWRAAVESRRAWDRSRATLRQPRWDRRELQSRLAQGGALAAIHRALGQQRWLDAHRGLSQHLAAAPQRFPLHRLRKDTFVATVRGRFPDAARQATTRADRIVAGEYDLLGYRGLRFAPAERDRQISPSLPDWHVDPIHGRRAPRRFWTTINYLNPEYGDHKIVWELNRHQHWLALGRAYWLSNETRYRDRFRHELASWLDANPPLTGINWASMLELALRTVSWLWALNFFVEDPPAAEIRADDRREEPWTVDLLLAIDRHLTQIERNLSRYFSPNTHLLGEGLALYVAGRTLPELAGSMRWEPIGRQLLLEGIDRQIGRDGGHAERSTHYHRYALDFCILALVVARLTQDPAASALERAVAQLAMAARLLADDNGRFPHVGDDDGGSLFPITGRDLDDIRDTLAIAAALVDRPELAVGPPPEEGVWMLGGQSAIRTRGPHGADCAPWSGSPESAIRSAALPDTGYYVSRSSDGSHLLIDGGPHGYQNGGHAHADALSLTLSVRGTPLLVDPGTCCYTTDHTIRDRFRSSALHNTLVLDGRSQSIPHGPFHWSHVGDGHIHCWRANEHFDYFHGSHDGYRPATHHRHVLAMHGDLLVVADFIDTAGPHTAAVHWHVHPEWHVAIDDRRVTFTRRNAPFFDTTFAAPRGAIDMLRGDEQSGLGWYSPVYGQLAELTTVRVTHAGSAPFWVAGVFDLSGRNSIDRVEWMAVSSAAGKPADTAALRIYRAGSVDYVLFRGTGGSAARDDECRRIGSSDARHAGELETDARMLFYRVDDEQRIVRFALVDGCLFRRTAGHVYLALPRQAPDVHVDLESCAA